VTTGSIARARWILPIHAGQVAVWQLAALAVLVPTFPANVAALVVAVAVVGLSSIRTGGLCAYEWALIYVRYRMRKPISAPAPMLAVLPNLYVHTHIDRAGNRVGVATVDTDYTVAIRLAPSAHPSPSQLITLLHKSFTRPDLQLSGAQLVVWAVPASPAPIRVHWLALRYRSDAYPLAALARGGSHEGGLKAAASAALRLVGTLADSGYASVVLDTLELHQELLVAVGAEAMHGPKSGSVMIRETWRDWSIGQIRQACYTPRRASDAVSLIGRYVPGSTFTCSSYTLSRTARGQIRAQAALRIGVSPDRPWMPPDTVSTRAGIPLLPTNGRQHAHVLATLPLAM
jgi:type VII secretion protein EccE